MASRVNTNFVIVLGVVLTVVFGTVAAVGYYKLSKGPEELAELGDKAAAQGNWIEAADFYSRAVNKDQTNPEWLRLWIGALEHIVPENPQQYVDTYFRTYLSALRGLAQADRANPDVHERLLGEHLTRISRFGGSLRAFEDLVLVAEESLKHFDGAPEKAAGIARYRGIARVGIYSVGTDLPPDLFEQTVADLTGALAAKPDDDHAAAALAELYRLRAARLRLDHETALADESIVKARAALDAFLEGSPGSVPALIELVRLEFSEAAAKASPAPSFANLVETHRGLIDRLVSAARTAPAGSVRPTIVGVAANIVQSIPDLGRDAAIAIIDNAMGASTDNATLLLEKAEVESRARNTEAALALLQRVIDLKDRPLSLDGLALLDQRTRAAARQIDTVLASWNTELGAAEKAAILARATGYRDALAGRIGAERSELDLIDAKLKYAAGELDAARTLLTRYNDKRGSNDPAALTLLGDILQRQGSLGAARSQYERAAQLRPSDGKVWLSLAGIDLAMREYDKAAERLRRVLQLDPGNDAAAAQLKVVEELRKGGEVTDPIVAALQDVQELTSGINPDGPGAIARLRAAVGEHGPDARLMRALTQLLAATGDRDGAVEAARAGLAAHPGNEFFAEMVRQLTAENPVEDALAQIEASDRPAFRKHLMRYEVLARAGRQDEAKAALDAARALEPDSPTILEHDFMAAIQAKDAGAARAIAERAIDKNADNVNGLSYRARLAFLDEKYDDAAAFLRQATEIDSLNPLLWRYLGETRAVLGQNDSALEAFAKAVEIRPSDLPSIKGLVRTQYLTGKQAEALATVRNASDLPAAASDPEFVELWVTLEASAAGGDRAKATEVRRQLAERNPKDRRNLASLVQLLTAQRQFEEARRLLDGLREGGVDLSIVELDARWHVTRGDLQGAADVYQAYITGLPAGTLTDAPYISMARLFVGANQPAAASQALEEARKHQDPKVLGADRELAELEFRYGQYDKSLERLRAILAAGATDDGDRLTRGIIECLNRLGRFDEAEAAIAALGDRADRDATLLTMRAAAAAGRGDRPRARTLLDRAIALETTSPTGYFARAEFLLKDPALAADAEADLLQVVRLDPAYPGARRLLAQIAINANRWDQALDHMRSAVTSSPDDHELRRTYINMLLSRGRGTEAIAQLDAALARDPDSMYWLLGSAEIHAAAGSPDRSIPHLERAWSLSKSPSTAVPYVLALIAGRQPNVAMAERILATPELQTDKSLVLMLMRARVRATAGNAQQSRADIEAAYRLVDQKKSEEVTLFFTGALGIVQDPATQLAMLESLRAVRPFSDWFLFNYAMVRQRTPEGLSGLHEVVAPLAEQTEDAQLAMSAMSFLGQVYRAQERFEEAAAAFKRLLDIVPDDANTNNNYAYVVGHDLGRAQEALPFAEKAARLLPRSSGTLHTLGVVAIGAGKLDLADSTLARALAAAGSPQEQTPVYLALTRLRLLQENRSEAVRHLERAEEIIGSSPQIAAMYGEEFQTLKKQLETR